MMAGEYPVPTFLQIKLSLYPRRFGGMPIQVPLAFTRGNSGYRIRLIARTPGVDPFYPERKRRDNCGQRMRAFEYDWGDS